MKHENTRALYRYWNSLRDGRAAPFRSELDPRAISPLLDSTFILEHAPDTTPRFRLAGTRLCDHFGMELRGMSALALWQGDARKQMREHLANVVEEPCVGHVVCTAETRSGDVFEAEILHLPLMSDLGEMTRILGCTQYIVPEGARIGRYEKMQHWIEAVNVYRIEDVLVDAEEAEGSDHVLPLRRKLDAPTHSRTRDARSTDRLAARMGEIAALRRRPKLRAIDGGVPLDRVAALRAQARSRISPKDRPRDHLRLVKSDMV